MRHTAAALLFAASVLGASPAHAQLFDVVGGLFESVHSIAFYGQAGALAGDAEIEGSAAGYGIAGAGLEVMLDLPSVAATELEMGLGASALGGFSAAEPTLDLRGSIRTLPSLSIYATGLGVDTTAAVQPYVGVQFGVSELWNARGYADDGTIYPVTGETFEIGAVVGAYVDVVPFRGLYVEAGYRRREFESLAWDAEQLPEGWPRALGASTWQATVGWQFRLR